MLAPHGTASRARALNPLPELAAIERTAGELAPAQLRSALVPILAHLESAPERPLLEALLAHCRAMYGRSRSLEALPVSRAVLAAAQRLAQPDLVRQAATACGMLAADSGDLVDAIEHHVVALRTALAADETEAIARVWNTIGLALGIGGHYELAARCYERAVERLRPVQGRSFVRYAALGNLADSLNRQGLPAAGLRHGYAALAEYCPEFHAIEPHNALVLHRNLALLHLALGEVEQAAVHVQRCREIAPELDTPRSAVALATTRAAYELACGRHDIALSLLHAVLERARALPAALRDTLAALARAEEASGNPERAMMRVNELTQHIHHAAVASVRAHRELAGLPLPLGNSVERDQQQARARLLPRLRPAGPPEAWPLLERMAMGACLVVDRSGLHGKRVGALVRGLAQAAGVRPLEALELGLAAELHDIGLSAVPPGVLAKKAPLDAHEQLLYDRHVAAGMELLADDAHPRMMRAREIVQYHHAHWGGGGHPGGVRGAAIPLGARLCAIADTYDSMIHGIHFSRAVSMNEGLAALRADAGTKFDPELVQAFQEWIRDRSDDLGVDLETGNATRGFRALIQSLHQDQGFM